MSSDLEYMFQKVPEFRDKVFEYCGMDGLLNLKKASKSVHDTLENQDKIMWKLYFKTSCNKVFKDYGKSYETIWKPVIIKIPIQLAKKLVQWIQQDPEVLKTKMGTHPLQYVIRNGDFEEFMAIFDATKYKTCPISPKCKGQNALHAVARTGKVQIFKILAREFEDLNPKDDVGITPLHLAVMNDHPEMVGLILKYVSKYSSIVTADNYGLTAFSHAIFLDQLEIFSLLMEKLKELNQTYDLDMKNLIFRGSLNIFKAYINEYDYPKHVALMDCIYYNKYEICKYLLENHTEETLIRDKIWPNPINLAVECKTHSILKLLVKYVEDIEECNPDGNTPLQTAFNMMQWPAFNILNEELDRRHGGIKRVRSTSSVDSSNEDNATP